MPRGGAETTQFESDRARFLGRGRSTANPAAMAPGVRLSGTAGPVLDPIFSLRTPVLVAPGKSVRLAFSTGLANSREGALALADQYHDLRVVQRAFELAWAQAQVELRHAHLSTSKVHLFQRLGAMLLYPDFTKRSAAALVANRSGQPALWRYGISGDYPILLARISEANQDGLVRELLLAHDSWRAKNFIVELVILNEHPTAYSDAVQDRLQRLLGESTAWSMVNKRGGIFILPGGACRKKIETCCKPPRMWCWLEKKDRWKNNWISPWQSTSCRRCSMFATSLNPAECVKRANPRKRRPNQPGNLTMAWADSRPMAASM